MSIFTDANVFLRFFTDGDPVQQQQADELFHTAASGLQLQADAVATFNRRHFARFPTPLYDFEAPTK